MCTYNITLSDSLVEKARPAIGNDIDIAQWMQHQMEALLIRLSVASRQDVDVVAEPFAPDLQAILSMPLVGDTEVGLNGEQARMDYLKERYEL